MDNLVRKGKLLEGAKYRYNFDRELYVNRHDRKVFSLEFVEDNDEESLRQKIAEENRGGWRFYFNAEPSPTIKQALQHELESLSA